MKREEFRPTAVVLTVVLACVLWFVTFYLSWATFWIKISVSAATLAILSLWIQPHRKHQFRFNKTAILLGLASAGVLYVIFWSGKTISSTIMPFAAAQINSIYEKGVGTHTGIIACLLFFITGPCEEIYWRGFLQKNLAVRFGTLAGLVAGNRYLCRGAHLVVQPDANRGGRCGGGVLGRDVLAI